MTLNSPYNVKKTCKDSIIFLSGLAKWIGISIKVQTNLAKSDKDKSISSVGNLILAKASSI